MDSVVPNQNNTNAPVQATKCHFSISFCEKQSHWAVSQALVKSVFLLFSTQVKSLWILFSSYNRFIVSPVVLLLTYSLFRFYPFSGTVDMH